jgi:hypothetical protein
MSRRDECEEDRHNAWQKSENVHQRITALKKVASNYPEYMTPLSDIAASYVEIGATEKAVQTYRKILDSKDTFDHVWDNVLGKAYLFVSDYARAIETLKNSAVFSWDQDLFLALSYLKNHEPETAKAQFHKWISEDLERAFRQYDYKKYLEALLDEEEKALLDTEWSKCHDKYSEMEPYQLYCELYDQHYLESLTSESDESAHEDEDDYDDFDIPPKFGRIRFEELKNEYLYLDRKSMLGHMRDRDYDRLFELRDLLLADVIF